MFRSPRVTARLVVRMQQGVTRGSCAQNSQSVEALIAPIPGIKLDLRSNGADVYSMNRAATADADPVVLIESRALYLYKAIVDVDFMFEPVGGARLCREGRDLVVITCGRMTKVAIEAGEQLASEGIDVAELDLRWLGPLDEPAIKAALVAVRCARGRSAGRATHGESRSRDAGQAHRTASRGSLGTGGAHRTPRHPLAVVDRAPRVRHAFGRAGRRAGEAHRRICQGKLDHTRFSYLEGMGSNFLPAPAIDPRDVSRDACRDDAKCK